MKTTKNSLKSTWGSIIGVMALLCALSLPSFVAASPILRSGETVTVQSDQVLEGDFYGLANTVIISGEAKNDVYVLGGSVTIDAPIAEDLVVLGGTVQVHAPVGDDIRVVGGEVVLADEVMGDVVVLSGALHILSDASVLGGLLFMGGTVDIEGNITGSVVGQAERVRIDAGVAGDVSVHAGLLTLGDEAEVLGNLTYVGNNEIARGQGAVVVGDITKRAVYDADESEYIAFFFMLTLLFAALSMFLLLKPLLQRLTDRTREHYGTQGLVGLAVFFSLPFVGMLLLLSVLGMLVGLMLLFAYSILILFALSVAGVIWGGLIWQFITKRTHINFVSTILGVISMIALLALPVIGPLLVFAFMLITLGGIVASIYTVLR